LCHNQTRDRIILNNKVYIQPWQHLSVSNLWGAGTAGTANFSLPKGVSAPDNVSMTSFDLPIALPCLKYKMSTKREREITTLSLQILLRIIEYFLCHICFISRFRVYVHCIIQWFMFGFGLLQLIHIGSAIQRLFFHTAWHVCVSISFAECCLHIRKSMITINVTLSMTSVLNTRYMFHKSLFSCRDFC